MRRTEIHRFRPAPSAVVLPALLLLLLPGAATAQTPRPEDVASIDAIIAAFYDVISGPAGGTVDVERDRSLHHPDAWVSIAGVGPDGERRVRVMTLDDYHGSNAPRQQAFWEWETEREVRRSGNMVHVWSHYASAREPGGEPFDRGVNSITLYDNGTRWWIMGWMFDQAAGAGGDG